MSIIAMYRYPHLAGFFLGIYFERSNVWFEQYKFEEEVIMLLSALRSEVKRIAVNVGDRAELEEVHRRAESFVELHKKRGLSSDEWRALHEVATLGKEISDRLKDDWGEIFEHLLTHAEQHLGLTAKQE
ncbi:MAG: hypothetical protein Q7S34_03005 [bacterium]|nr:hypothetical protein [bacterium]